MARPGTDPKLKQDDNLINRIEALENLSKKLLEALELAEIKIQKSLKDEEIYLIPSGTYYGKSY